ncbi:MULTISPECIES: hypothetical protein [unclassified Beijerinckia]|uniref:LVIVD repeat-containing protein n=1 Tax=unclassified Beijerinckia TaxID=2638183 RepID=UPI0008952930|nr:MULTISPECIES: hypothetical protein [unclassified Beijerinckia]MDH7794230.1 hypothetical protein [Beijerinckia sp. GAS462]SEB56357.1 Uncharacterized conserved protein [Beijerinckia sp. 28-YEA-48]
MGNKTKICFAAVLMAAVSMGSSFNLNAAPLTKSRATNALPAGWQASNMQPLAYIQAAPNSTRAFKMSMKRVDDRWYLFAATGGRDGGGFEVIDVTDPAKPVRVTAVQVPGSNGQLTLHDNLLIIAQQVPYARNSPQENAFAGVPNETRSLATFFDISDPRQPTRLSSWEREGWASHRNVYPGGRYAYMSAWIPGYKGQATLTILDVSDPRKPVEVGHWWQPGQKDGEPDRAPPNGYHGPATISPDGKRLTTAYTPSLVNLDISDPSQPKLIGKLDFSPLAQVGAQALHTGIPLPGGMVHVNTEPSKQGCDKENAHFAAIVDNNDPSHPRLVSYYPRPVPPKGAPYRSFCDKGGRFGPHNVNGEIHAPALQTPGPLIYMTYFTAGVRVYDVSNPYEPREAGWFLPFVGAWETGDRGLEDVVVDTRGNAFVSDGSKKGIWVLRYTGRTPPASKSAVSDGRR